MPSNYSLTIIPRHSRRVPLPEFQSRRVPLPDFQSRRVPADYLALLSISIYVGCSGLLHDLEVELDVAVKKTGISMTTS